MEGMGDEPRKASCGGVGDTIVFYPSSPGSTRVTCADSSTGRGLTLLYVLKRTRKEPSSPSVVMWHKQIEVLQ